MFGGHDRDELGGKLQGEVFVFLLLHRYPFLSMTALLPLHAARGIRALEVQRSCSVLWTVLLLALHPVCGDHKEEMGAVRNWSTTCASSRALVPSPRCPSWKT